MLHSIEVVKDDSAVALDHHDLSGFIGIRPADVHVSENIVGIAEGDKTHVIPAIPQDLPANSADPPRRAVQQVIKDSDVMRGKVPESVYVAADRAEVCPSGIQIVYAPAVLLHVLLHLADARIEDECVTHHQGRGLRVRQLDQFLRVGRGCCEWLFHKHVFSCQQQTAGDVEVRSRFRANNHSLHVRLRNHIFDLRRQIHVGEPPRDLLQTFRALLANGNDTRLRQFVEDSNVVHSPIAASDDRDARGPGTRHVFPDSKRKDGVAH